MVASNIKSGVNIFGVTGSYTNDATASSSEILSGYTAYNAGTKLTGTIPNLTAETTIDFQSSNTTPVIEGDTAFWTTNSDGVVRCCIRWPGPNGYIEGNTLFGIPQETMAAAVGLTADKIVAGNSVMGISGTARAGSLQLSCFSKANTSSSNAYVTITESVPGRIVCVNMNTSGNILDSYLAPVWFPGLGYYCSTSTNSSPTWTDMTGISKWTPYSAASYPMYLTLSSDYTTVTCQQRVSGSDGVSYVNVIYIT